MLDDRGDRITDRQVLDRVADIGAMVVQRQSVEATDVATWRRELRVREVCESAYAQPVTKVIFSSTILTTSSTLLA